MEDWQIRTKLLLDAEAQRVLYSAHVLVVGLGGVGAYAAEMLARSGVPELTLVDADTVQASNINRQLIALHSTLRCNKTEVVAARLRDINPKIRLHLITEFMQDEKIPQLFSGVKYSYVVDAIDTLAPKTFLIANAIKNEIPIVSAMGAGGKMDPSLIRVADIKDTHTCKLAHALRKRLHKLGIRSGVRAVFSTEEVDASRYIACDEQNKKTIVGTISYMPAIFGCLCASEVIRGAIGQ